MCINATAQREMERESRDLPLYVLVLASSSQPFCHQWSAVNGAQMSLLDSSERC